MVILNEEIISVSIISYIPAYDYCRFRALRYTSVFVYVCVPNVCEITVTDIE